MERRHEPGVNIYEVQERIGHSDLEMFKRYNAVGQARSSRAAKQDENIRGYSRSLMQIMSQVLRQNKRRHLWRKYCRNLERNFDGNSVAVKHANKKRIKLDVYIRMQLRAIWCNGSLKSYSV
jgi:hypothetical protein